MDAARSRRSRPGAALAVVAAALGACDGPTPEARTSATDPSSSASVAPEATLRCADAIDWVAVPPAHYRAVLDAVALTRGGAPAADWDPRSYAGRSGLLFAKSGLLVRPGAPAELVVPPGSPLRIGWGHGAEPTTRLRLPACTADAGEGGWLAFAGGVWVREPGCYELAVRVGDREELVRIGVFAACPAASAP